MNSLVFVITKSIVFHMLLIAFIATSTELITAVSILLAMFYVMCVLMALSVLRSPETNASACINVADNMSSLAFKLFIPIVVIYGIVFFLKASMQNKALTVIQNYYEMGVGFYFMFFSAILVTSLILAMLYSLGRRKHI